MKTLISIIAGSITYLVLSFCLEFAGQHLGYITISETLNFSLLSLAGVMVPVIAGFVAGFFASSLAFVHGAALGPLIAYFQNIECKRLIPKDFHGCTIATFLVTFLFGLILASLGASFWDVYKYFKQKRLKKKKIVIN